MSLVNPLVTVVMPCFNAAQTVAATLASVRRQTYRPIEIIAVDDCSSDATVAILRRETQQGDLALIVCETNGGPAVARNRAIAVARGEFLAFIDADDEWHPDKLARQLHLLAANPAMILVGCRAEVAWIGGTRTPVNGDRAPPCGDEAWRCMLHHSYLVPSVVIVRTAAARKIGGFDGNIRSGEEDQDFFIRLALEGQVGFVDAQLTTMNEQPRSMTRRYAGRQHETSLPMILRHYRAQLNRLSWRERRTIRGARYGDAGRNIYPAVPAAGARLLLKAVSLGDRPGLNLYHLLAASPWIRRLKRILRGSPRGTIG